MTMDIKFKLANEHAIVTGGGRGIGAAISSALARAGARVTIMGRDKATIERHAKSLGDEAAAIVQSTATISSGAVLRLSSPRTLRGRKRRFRIQSAITPRPR